VLTLYIVRTGGHMTDRNEVKLSGLVISDPTFTRMAKSNTPIVSFLIQVEERFVSNGKPATHPNVILIESLGQHAEVVMKKVKKGLRYEVVGYIRAEQSKVSVRSFNVNFEEKDESLKYLQGIEAALEIVMNSRDKVVAVEYLRQILHEGQNAN
jgi:primosomal replication protein N